MRNVLIDAAPLIALSVVDDGHRARYTEKYKREMVLADASLLWLAHETGLREIMTVDMNDFARYRLPDGEALALL